MIVLLLPESGRLELADGDASELADRLWELAMREGRTATVAVAIQEELRRHFRRQPVEVPAGSAERVVEAVRRL